MVWLSGSSPQGVFTWLVGRPREREEKWLMDLQGELYFQLPESTGRLWKVTSKCLARGVLWILRKNSGGSM